MTTDCTMIDANLQSKNAQLNKAKEQKEIMFSSNRILQLNN